MRTSRVAVVLPLAFACMANASADPLRADHPMIGTWRLEIPNSKCAEVYRIRKDGSAAITSGDEAAETTFTISDKPSAKGFYKWVVRIAKDNGKKDCSGEIMQIGQELTNYVNMHPSGAAFLLCEREDINTCLGPVTRQKDGDN